MKIYRFLWKGEPVYGVLYEENLQLIQGSIFEPLTLTAARAAIGEVELLAPVVPSKIVAVGVNYKDHALERGRPLPEEPLLFLKPPSAVVGPNAAILYPRMSQRVDFEGELAVVIKKKACRINAGERVEDYVLGYTCFNDVTARDLQDKDVQFTRAKSFDTFAAVGPCIATDIDPADLEVKTFLNGKLRQSSSTKNLVFPVSALVRYISQIMTLWPGDLITTGTPAGVGPMQPGDRVDVQIENIGTLSNTVQKAPQGRT